MRNRTTAKHGTNEDWEPLSDSDACHYRDSLEKLLPITVISKLQQFADLLMGTGGSSLYAYYYIFGERIHENSFVGSS